MNKEAFEKENVFGIGQPNTGYAQCFTGNSYLNPLADPAKSSLFLANVTFEPGCRNAGWERKPSQASTELIRKNPFG